MRRLRIGVAGCGVAGLACAAFLAREGHDVTIYDKLDAPSPVGSGLILQPVGLAVLEALGTRSAIEARGAVINRLYGLSNGRTVLDVRYEALGEARGLAVHRAALFDVLHAAAVEAGAAITPSREIASAPLAGDRRVLRFADGDEAGAFDLVIDALGVRSELSRPGAPLTYGALWANVPWPEGFAGDALEQRYYRASKMAGVLPIGTRGEGGPREAAYFWSLRGADHAAWRAGSLDAWKAEAIALWPQTEALLAHIGTHDDLVFARYAHRTLARATAPALAHVGDSFHCTSPQLGQGANMALLDAFALHTALARADNLDVALWEYERMRRWHVRLYQAASFLFTPVYQSDSAMLPWLRDRIVGPLAKLWPAPQILAGLVSGVLGAPLGAMKGA